MISLDKALQDPPEQDATARLAAMKNAICNTALVTLGSMDRANVKAYLAEMETLIDEKGYLPRIQERAPIKDPFGA